MSSYIREFRAYLRKNDLAKGLFLVGVVLLGAIAVWGGIRLALGTEYPILVVSSPSMCPPTNCVLPVGALIVIRGQNPSMISNGSIIVFRPWSANPNYLVVHRVVQIYTPNQNPNGEYVFITKGDANYGRDTWECYNGGVCGSKIVGVYQTTIPIPLLGSAILSIRSFMYDDNTGQPKLQGIVIVVALIAALFAFEVMEPSKKITSTEQKASPPSSAFSRTRFLGNLAPPTPK
ncbi:MAG TPA: signal peptidase I [Candidatus Bathyarchaeia archaeon]|nr:signal peptidase I [Candidatus Bathyarchaeia archaeon]